MGQRGKSSGVRSCVSRRCNSQLRREMPSVERKSGCLCPAHGLPVPHACSLCFLLVLRKNELLGWDFPPLQGFGH